MVAVEVELPEPTRVLALTEAADPAPEASEGEAMVEWVMVVGEDREEGEDAEADEIEEVREGDEVVKNLVA